MEQDTIRTLADLLSFSKIFASAVVVVLAWLSLKVLYSLIWVLTARFSRYRLQITRFTPVVRLLVWTSAAYIIVVYIFQPKTNAILALAASFGIALGLALQDLVKNLISGILILVDQPFRVGDMIEVDGHYGEVVNIGLRSTRIHTFDDSIVTVPNSSAIGQSVSNSNTGELNEMVVVTFDVPASVDVQEIRNLAWEAAASSPYVYMKKGISVVCEDRFDRTFLTRFKVKSYVSDIRLERVLASDITQRIKTELVRRGIISEDLVIKVLNQTA